MSNIFAVRFDPTPAPPPPAPPLPPVPNPVYPIILKLGTRTFTGTVTEQ